MDNLSGQTVNGYLLHEQIGSGAHGAIYRGENTETGQVVAVKVLRTQANTDDAHLMERMTAEANIVKRLDHAHIVPLLDFWVDAARVWMVMRWLKGGNLRDIVEAGPWDLNKTAMMLAQVGDALAAAHEINVIHRDIKPDNILFDEQGTAFLADFGVAKRLDQQQGLTGTGMMVGSPAYLSPEQITTNSVSPKTDIYAMGLTVYEALTGEHPYVGTVSQLQMMMNHMQKPLPSLHEKRPDLPEAVNVVIQTATAKDPSDRYDNMPAFVAAFQAAVG